MRRTLLCFMFFVDAKKSAAENSRKMADSRQRRVESVDGVVGYIFLVPIIITGNKFSKR